MARALLASLAIAAVVSFTSGAATAGPPDIRVKVAPKVHGTTLFTLCVAVPIEPNCPPITSAWR